jgi:tRNA nucleotidyltransferase (CCA-adding enzyme)
VKEFTVPLAEQNQVVLFHEVLAKLETLEIRGHRFRTCYMELEEDSRGLGAVVEQVFEVEHAELLFGFFFFPEVPPTRGGPELEPQIPLDELFADLGGGGHRQAASATIKTDEGRELTRGILGYVERMLHPATCARDLMTADPLSIPADATLMEASILLEEGTHTGAPVVDSSGALVGLLTLRDIMGGRRGNQ